jgi:hypothetical protein
MTAESFCHLAQLSLIILYLFFVLELSIKSGCPGTDVWSSFIMQTHHFIIVFIINQGQRPIPSYPSILENKHPSSRPGLVSSSTSIGPGHIPNQEKLVSKKKTSEIGKLDTRANRWM